MCSKEYTNTRSTGPYSKLLEIGETPLSASLGAQPFALLSSSVLPWLLFWGCRIFIKAWLKSIIGSHRASSAGRKKVHCMDGCSFSQSHLSFIYLKIMSSCYFLNKWWKIARIKWVKLTVIKLGKHEIKKVIAVIRCTSFPVRNNTLLTWWKTLLVLLTKQEYIYTIISNV